MNSWVVFRLVECEVPAMWVFSSAHFITSCITQSMNASVDLFLVPNEARSLFVFALLLDGGLRLGLEWQVAIIHPSIPPFLPYAVFRLTLWTGKVFWVMCAWAYVSNVDPCVSRVSSLQQTPCRRTQLKEKKKKSSHRSQAIFLFSRLKSQIRYGDMKNCY